MQVTSDFSEVRAAVDKARRAYSVIGCVPTMGALHAGHISLVDKCRHSCDFVCLTIFVNPTQFAPTEDLAKYPRPIEADLEKCRAAGVDLVFMPEVAALYPEGYQTWVTVDEVTQPLEGSFRPTHFRGVTTIVAKLFNIVQPNIACFGAKDYQQLAAIRRMVRDLNFPIEVLTGPTIRDPDGLAMSSRNVYLSPAERLAGLSLSQSLQVARQRLQSGETDLGRIEQEMIDQMEAHQQVKVQYAVIADPDSLQELDAPQSHMVGLIAALVGRTRLIDNLEISLEPPTQNSNS